MFIRKTLDDYGSDAEFLCKLVEAIMKVNTGSGFGKVTIHITQRQIAILRSEETQSFNNVKEEPI